MQILKLS